MNAANIAIDDYKTMSKLLHKYFNHENASHYVLYWKEAYGPFFEMSFF